MNTLYQTHWIFSAVAHSIVAYVIGRLVLYSYREHSYLYQFDGNSKAIKNAVDVLLPWAKRMPVKRYRTFLEDLMTNADYSHDWDSSHFMALQAIYGFGSFVVGYVLLNLILGMPLWVTIMISLIALFIPITKLFDRSKKRIKSCQRELPYFIDYLSLTMGAGLDFNQGLSAVISDSPPSPLRNEFTQMLRNMKLGMSREEALNDIHRRVNTPGMRLFTQTLSQAIKMGSDIAQTLSVMGETMQTKRFQKAEEAAGKISIRMMIPMMIFVMPATIIILLGPMILEWVSSTN